MSIKHSATLAILIGWFLMFPPLINRSGVLYMEPDVSAPLTEWRPAQLEAGTLDSKSVCENSRLALVSNAKNLLQDAPADLGKMRLEESERAGKWIFALEAAASRCIADDDPRLKAK
jgi:hypothetical protein